jgi:hypothetical protein
VYDSVQAALAVCMVLCRSGCRCCSSTEGNSQRSNCTLWATVFNAASGCQCVLFHPSWSCLSCPCSAREAVQWVYFAYLGAVKEQVGGGGHGHHVRAPWHVAGVYHSNCRPQMSIRKPW